MLYALTIAGVAYHIRLTDITNYASCTAFPPSDVVEFSIQNYGDYGAITAISATMGCLVIGGRTGLVGCFRLGFLDSSDPGYRLLFSNILIIHIYINLLSDVFNYTVSLYLVLIYLVIRKPERMCYCVWSCHMLLSVMLFINFHGFL